MYTPENDEALPKVDEKIQAGLLIGPKCTIKKVITIESIDNVWWLRPENKQFDPHSIEKGEHDEILMKPHPVHGDRVVVIMWADYDEKLEISPEQFLEELYAIDIELEVKRGDHIFTLATAGVDHKLIDEILKNIDYDKVTTSNLFTFAVVLREYKSQLTSWDEFLKKSIDKDGGETEMFAGFLDVPTT